MATQAPNIETAPTEPAAKAAIVGRILRRLVGLTPSQRVIELVDREIDERGLRLIADLTGIKESRLMQRDSLTYWRVAVVLLLLWKKIDEHAGAHEIDSAACGGPDDGKPAIRNANAFRLISALEAIKTWRASQYTAACARSAANNAFAKALLAAYEDVTLPKNGAAQKSAADLAASKEMLDAELAEGEARADHAVVQLLIGMARQ